MDVADDDAIILVDSNDVQVGIALKTEAHRRGLSHRAISVLIRNRDGHLLLQRRNPAKYHSGGLWANACCTHPRPRETTLDAAKRRLREEMGVNCTLARLFTTRYRATVSNGYTENEFVHVFSGTYDGLVTPDPTEVSEWRWMPFDEVWNDQTTHPDRYTIWFRHYIRAFRIDIADWLNSTHA